MLYKVIISNDIVLSECIEFVSFRVESQKDEYTGKSYPLNSMIIEGKIGTDENTIPLYKWASIPATNPNCYKEITVEQTLADQLIRKVTFQKAFVVDYSESHTDKTGFGYFSLYVRQLVGFDIECSDGQPIVKKENDIVEKILNRNFVVNNIENQIMQGQAGKPPDFEMKEQGIKEELKKSKIGREVLKYIDDNNVPVLLSYEPKKSKMGNRVNGHYDPEFDICRVFVLNTLFYEDSAKTVIHEVTHYMGYRQTRYFEFFARYLSEKHIYEGKVPLSVIRKHYKTTFKSGEYDKLPLGMPNGKRKRLEKKGLIKSVRR